MGLRLVDMESRLKKLVDNDINDPKVYNAIYDLLYNFLIRKKLLNSYQDYEEVSHIGAEHLYMHILNGAKITSWLGYINLSYMSYINRYKRFYRSELIDTNSNPELADAIVTMSASSALQNNIDLETIVNMQYIEKSITNTIKEVLNLSRYVEYSKEYYDAMLSLLLSIINGNLVIYGDRKEKSYINILYVLTKDKICRCIGQGNYNFNDVLRQYTMEMSIFSDGNEQVVFQ